MRKFLIFCFLFLFVFLLSGCDKSIDKKKVKDKVKDKVEYKTTDIYFDKIISTEVGDFSSFKYKYAPFSTYDKEIKKIGGFYFLKMRKSDFNSDDVLDLISNFFKDNSESHYNFYIIFDDSTAMRINISNGLSSVNLFYSNLESRYIDFFDKYKDLANSSIVYKFPFSLSSSGDEQELDNDNDSLDTGDLDLLKNDDSVVVDTYKGVFRDDSPEDNPMNKDCILYPFVGVNIKDRDSN